MKRFMHFQFSFFHFPFRQILLLTLAVAVMFPATASASLTNGANAVDMIGQLGDNVNAPDPIYSKNLAHNIPNRLGLSGPRGVELDTVSHRLFVAEVGNYRVLVFGLNSDNTFTDYVPDNVLGQSVFYTKNGGTNQYGLISPIGLAYDATNSRLFVAESGNQRVTIFDVASITNGENAVNVLGQPDFSSTSVACTQNGMRYPYFLAYDSNNSRLFVADYFNNRVIVYATASIVNGQNASNVLGQPNYTAGTSGTTQNGMSSPYGLAYDSTNSRLFVAEYANNRVTVYDVTSITDGQNASNVLGQPNFSRSTSAYAQNGMNQPFGLAYDSTNSRLFVAERNNSRVTVFATSSITDGQNATNVLGQSSFAYPVQNYSQDGMYYPQGLAYDTTNSRLYLTDTGCHRLTVYSVSTITNGQNAINALGQYGSNILSLTPSYTRAAADNVPNSLGLNYPSALVIDSNNHRLFVSDGSNHRVLVYSLNADNSFSDRVPDNVLGQTDFIRNGYNTTQNSLNYPYAIAYDATNTRLFVGESGNYRVVVYSVPSITNGQNATNVLGQPNFAGSSMATTQNGMKQPYGLTYDPVGSRLFIADLGNNRVLVQNIATIVNGQNATFVLGQSNFLSGAAATTQNGINSPRGMSYDASSSRLFVANNGNHRITVYDVSSISNGQNAANVLGQPNYLSSFSVATQNGMSQPTDVAYDDANSRIFIGEQGNHRITIQNVASITDGQNAVYVLGQPNFVSSSSATSQSRLNTPSYLAIDSTNALLFVSEWNNHRVMVFDTSRPPSVISAKPSSDHSIVLASDGTTDVL